MKNILSLILITFSLISCEDVVDVDLPTAPPRLVIEAFMERTIDQDDAFAIKDNIKVALSLTTPFFSETPSFVDNATVNITNITDNVNFSLINNSQGVYTLSNGTPFNIEFNKEYKLTVMYNGNTYEATESLQKSTPIDDAFQIKNDTGLADEDFAVRITYTDLVGKGSHYGFDFGKGDIFSTDDEFIDDGKPFSFTNFFDGDIDKNLVIRLLGTTKQLNSYIDAIVQLSDDDSNGPFGIVPFKAKGNIVNTTNKENFAFGYFRVNEVYIKEITLVDNQSL